MVRMMLLEESDQRKENFKKYIQSIADEIQDQLYEQIIKERGNIFDEAAAKGFLYSGVVTGKLIDLEKKIIDGFTDQFISRIIDEIEKEETVFWGQDLQTIYLIGDVALQHMFLKSDKYLKDYANKRGLSSNLTNKVGLFVDDRKNKLRLKIEQLKLKSMLKVKKHLAIDEIGELGRIKEIVSNWACCKKKDVITVQIDNFINNEASIENLIAIYRTTIPEIEDIMREFAEKRGIEKSINSIGDGINVLKENNFLKNETLALLGLVHEPYRHIAEHGLKPPVLVLKLLCLSAFEAIRFLYEAFVSLDPPK